MANFNTYLPLLQQVEGGFQKNPKDMGNYNSLNQLVGTQFGISARFYEGIIGYPPSEVDMRAITKSHASGMYRVYFWNANRASEINSQAIANTVIDHQINAGNGVQVAQRLLNSHFNFNLSTDNIIGSNTLAALNSVNEGKFVTLFNDERAKHYKTRSNSSEFAAGWLVRLANFSVDYKRPMSYVGIIAFATIGLISYQYLKN